MPAGFSVYANEQGFTVADQRDPFKTYRLENLRSMTVYESGATLWIEVYEVKDAAQVVDYLLNYTNFKESIIKKISFEGFTGYEIKAKSSLFDEYYFADKAKIYYVGIAARKPNNLMVTKFLTSLSLRGKYPFTAQAKKEETAETLIIDDIQSMSIAFETADKNDVQAASATTPTDPLTEKDVEPLKILIKPHAQYTDDARRNGVQGTVLLSSVFLANGTVGTVTIIKGLKNGITENAVRAARRMKFFPAEKAGVPITVTKKVQYNFVLY